MSSAPYNTPPGFDWIVRLKDWRLHGRTLQLTGQTHAGREIVVAIQAVSPHIWRYVVHAPNPPALKPTFMALEPTGEPLPVEVEEVTRAVVVRGSSLSIFIEQNPWVMRFKDSYGHEVLAENPSDIDGLGRPFVPRLGYVMDDHNTRMTIQSFHLRQDEHLFGLGEKFTPLDKRGQRIISWNLDALGSTSERSHKNIPFLISTRGYGLFVETGARITWEVGTVSAQSYTFHAESPILDVYVIHGLTPAEILGRYADLTGHSPVPPKWSFGLWLSSGGTYRDRNTIEALVSGLAEHDLPADVVHIDPWWMKWRRYCDFRWDEKAFPDVEGFIRNLHEQDLKLCLWEHPYVSVESDLFQVGKNRGYFVKRPDGEEYVINYGLSLAPRPDGIVREATAENSWNAPVAIIDLTNPEAYTWFQDLHRPVFRQGADVFKTDFGEDIPEDAQFSDGQTGRTMHNLYPLLYNRAVFEVTQEEKGHGIVWSRSGTSGSQRYPVCWSGDPAADFDSLACTIRGGLSAGLSGLPFWSNDIGSYRGKPSPRLYVRWAQFGLFCSHSRMHGDSPREPWQFGEEALKIVRRYVRLRYQLFPYIYSCAWEASLMGLPVLRAMPLAFPGDPNAFDKDLQYMFGPWLLVAPIYDESDERYVYLPGGRWVDYWSGEMHDGPRTLRVRAPLDTLPLFIKGGALIPMMAAANRIPEGRIDPLIVEIHPSGKSVYELHEDEGTTAFTCEEEEKGVVFGWDGSFPRSVTVRLRNESRPFRVTEKEPGDGVLFENIVHRAEDGSCEIMLSGAARGRIRLIFAD